MDSVHLPEEDNYSFSPGRAGGCSDGKKTRIGAQYLASCLIAPCLEYYKEKYSSFLDLFD